MSEQGTKYLYNEKTFRKRTSNPHYKKINNEIILKN